AAARCGASFPSSTPRRCSTTPEGPASTSRAPVRGWASPARREADPAAAVGARRRRAWRGPGCMPRCRTGSTGFPFAPSQWIGGRRLAVGAPHPERPVAHRLRFLEGDGFVARRACDRGMGVVQWEARVHVVLEDEPGNLCRALVAARAAAPLLDDLGNSFQLERPVAALLAARQFFFIAGAAVSRRRAARRRARRCDPRRAPRRPCCW